MKHCTTDKCPQILDSSCVFYEGPSLIFSGINTNDSVEVVIQKLNLKLESIPGINLDNYYDRQDINNFLSYKADISSLSQVAFSGDYLDLNNKPNIPTKTSDLENDSEFITRDEVDDIISAIPVVDLSNYYTKSETFSQTEINNLLNNKQNNLVYTPENIVNKSDSYTASSSTTYASSRALVEGLATKFDKGTYTGTAQSLKNEIDSKQKLLSSFDESILVETDGNIEGNVSLFEEYFEQQECELNFIPIQIIGVYINGIKQKPSLYTITLPKKITVANFTSGDYIEIQYTKLKI